jgi:hypothetical protein
MPSSPAGPANPATNDFQRAAAAAKAAAARPAWFELSPAEQTQAIYAQLRLIDAARAKALAILPRRRSRHDGESASRKAAT